MSIPAIRIRGIRQTLPSGYVIGRTSSGSGDAELIPLGNLAAGLAPHMAASGGGGGSAVLPDSGVAAGTYTLATITVTAKGIVTSASNGSAPGSTGIRSLLVAGDILTGDQPDFIITLDGDLIEVPA